MWAVRVHGGAGCGVCTDVCVHVRVQVETACALEAATPWTAKPGDKKLRPVGPGGNT